MKRFSASYPQHGGDEVALIACADKAMYQAKSAGRDRVVIAEMPMVTAA